MMQSMMTPENIQRAMGMMGPGGMGGGMPPGMGGFGGMPPGMSGGMPQMGEVQQQSSSTPADPRTKYATELAQIKEMGFSDEEKILSVLQQTNGSVAIALDRLFSEM